MLSDAQLVEIAQRIASSECEADPARLRADALALMAEVERIGKTMNAFTANVTSRLNELERDMLSLESENARLRSVTQSTYFERDACVGLISKFAVALGLTAGTGRFEVVERNREGNDETQAQNRVLVDLPSGQVSWEYLDEDAHLFESLPPYPGAVEPQSIRDIYSKVMNPGIPATSPAGQA